MASVMVDRPPSAHGKLHKRNGSDTVRLPYRSPTMPSPIIGKPSLDFKRKVTYEEPPSPSTSSLKIKPYVRKASGKDSISVDLSRSMAENESLTGLGLGIDDSTYANSYTLGARNASDVTFTPVRAHRHRRSTSGNSHLSTTSNGLRQQPSTYSHPLRQTPRPYTPPMSESYLTAAGGGSGSGNSEEDITNGIPRPADESEALRRLMSNSSSEPFSRKSGSFTNFPVFEASAPQPLQQRSSDLAARFDSTSQTSLGNRSRRATLQSVDTVSPSSRASLDKAFSFVRGQRSNDTTATELVEIDSSHAASVRAARLAYQEREAAKDRKAEKEELKQVEKEQKKQHKKEDKRRRKSEAKDRPGHFSSDDINDEKNASIGGGEYSYLKPANSAPLHSTAATAAAGKASSERHELEHNSARRSTQRKKNRGPKSTWAIFLAWFRTRLLRMGG